MPLPFSKANYTMDAFLFISPAKMCFCSFLMNKMKKKSVFLDAGRGMQGGKGEFFASFCLFAFFCLHFFSILGKILTKLATLGGICLFSP